MTVKSFVAACFVGLIVAACVPTDRPPPTALIQQVENQKKLAANLRERGVISYEEAARRQFEEERANYSLDARDLETWRAAIALAHAYDYRQITLKEYNRRKAILFADYLTRER